ncbi:30S ribosomal protein S14 [Streptomyces sp. NPDC058385]|uniref:30S ribosomal protein S14 n=1 Tax=unclassified Streptomyces TaxID=2593676 RepID=UPI0036511BE6
MARKSKTTKGEKRRRVAVRCAVCRAELNEIVRRLSSTTAERAAMQRKLARQPRDASAARVGNRDSTDGPPRGYRRAFGLSRVSLREQARAGFLPGVRKSSW